MLNRKPEDFSRIVVKIGSSLLVDRETGSLNSAWLDALADDLVALAAGNRDVLVVSSGAISLGRYMLGLGGRSLRLDEGQAAAAVGQVALARAWAKAFGDRGLAAGQILLTLGDTEERRRYLNARSTITTLLKFKAVPVINENDTVATTEIRYGDNDRLAARVATMVSADLLVLLSDVDGLYSAPPNENRDAEFIDLVDRVTPEIEAMAGAAGTALSSGGMRTKVEAARIATAGGATMVIAGGHRLHSLAAISAGGRCTWFLADTKPATARKKWISGHLEVSGAVVVDAGAAGALRNGKSLLPAGVVSVQGRFQRGDAVRIVGPEHQEIGRGLVAFDADEADRIRGRNSAEIEAILGYAGRPEMIHRDDMVIGVG
ncbi:MAG: glutamate 5-kinase [Alphaproteobacteria bacterium]